MSLLIIFVFAIMYSIFSNIIEIYLKKDKKIQKIYKKLENYFRKNLREKALESYLDLFKVMKKYIFLNIFFGLSIFVILWLILKNTTIFINILNLHINWFWIYFILVFVLNLIFKYFFKLIFKTWEKK